jgi:hypothetical protein
LTEAFTRFGTSDFMKKELCDYLTRIEADSEEWLCHLRPDAEIPHRSSN